MALQENGGTSSAIVGDNDHSCPRLNDGKTEDDALDNDKNSNAVVKIVFARLYLVDTIRITESDDGAQAEEIRVSFSDGSNQIVSTENKGFKYITVCGFNCRLHCAPFYSTVLSSVPLCPILYLNVHYFTPLFSTVLHSTLLCSITSVRIKA